jgi:hypothetical protein
VTGHTAHTGHKRALDTERESQVTHVDLEHGVRVQMLICIYLFHLPLKFSSILVVFHHFKIYKVVLSSNGVNLQMLLQSNFQGVFFYMAYREKKKNN